MRPCRGLSSRWEPLGWAGPAHSELSCSPTLLCEQPQCWVRDLTPCAHFQGASLFTGIQPSSGAVFLHPIYKGAG